MQEIWAYYNERDAKAAAWIRELIKKGLVAPGEVDERSIEDVTPDELRGFTQLHFFAGIAVWSYALRRAGWPDSRRVITGSCPCQPFSAAGKGEGFADERHLWPAFFHIIHALQGYTEWRGVEVFGEQVSSQDGLAWLDLVCSDLEGIGYTVGANDIPACSVGAPHRRQRLYWVAYAGHAELSGRLGPAERQQHRNGDARRDADSRRAFGELADTDGGNARTERQQRGGEQRREPQDGGALQLVDTVPAGRPEGWPESGKGQTSGIGKLDGLDNPAGSRLAPEVGGQQEQSESGQCVSGVGCETRGVALGNASGERLQGCTAEWQIPRRETSTGHVGSAGFTNGFWRDAEWIYCRDGKYRPTKPGIFPLAHGSAGRVALLRGAGNAIVSEVAVEFIRSYL